MSKNQTPNDRPDVIGHTRPDIRDLVIEAMKRSPTFVSGMTAELRRLESLERRENANIEATQ